MSSALNPKINTLQRVITKLIPERRGCYFMLVIFKLISRIDILSISCEIALKWMIQDNTDDKSTLPHVMDWCEATNHYLYQCWPSYMSLLGHNEVNKTQHTRFHIYRHFIWYIIHNWPMFNQVLVASYIWKYISHSLEPNSLHVLKPCPYCSDDSILIFWWSSTHYDKIPCKYFLHYSPIFWLWHTEGRWIYNDLFHLQILTGVPCISLSLVQIAFDWAL